MNHPVRSPFPPDFEAVTPAIRANLVRPRSMNTGTQPHILVIDDDAAMRKLITDYLAENELRVTAAANGAEMQQALAQHTIDLVVLDLRLAGEDGMQLARKLREESEMPIVMVTGKQEEADRVMGLELGADDYIVKPFSTRELLARIRAVLRRYQTAQALLPGRDDKRRACAGSCPTRVRPARPRG